jgi:DNA adenine methylase
MLNQPKPLVQWFGGKARMAKLIANRMPPHKFYVEPFGGAAGVLMAKTPCYNEIYNDLHSGIVNLFRVVRDAEKCSRLIELINLTPYSRDEWAECNNSWEIETDEIEKARKVFVTLQQNFVGVTRGGAWDCDGLSGKNNKPAAFFNSLENIKAVTKRIQNVTIENKPALEVMERFDSNQTLIYADPPYLPETWMGKGYKHEMSTEEHCRLLDFLTTAKSMVILSGYPSQLYTTTLDKAGWAREDFEAIASSALRSRRNGLKNAPPEKFNNANHQNHPHRHHHQPQTRAGQTFALQAHSGGP